MTESEKLTYYNRFKRFQQSREKYYAPKFKKALNNQFKSFLDAYKSGQSVTNALMAVTLSEIAPILKDLYIDAATVYGAYILSDLKKVKAMIPMGFSLRMRQLMEEYYMTDILNDASEINNTTREIIQNILIQAEQNGRGIDWISEQLMTNNLSDVRSRLIARTETVTAANKGAIIAAKESGLNLKKEWLATMDNRTRKDHLLFNGQITSMDGYFEVNGITMKQPGDRVQKNGLPVPAKEVCNCRCTVLFNPQRNANGRLI